MRPGAGVPREKVLFDPRSSSRLAKRVLASDRPDDFRPAFGRVGQKVLAALASGPKYPAEIARELGAHHQTIYYHVKRLERAGLITKGRSRVIRGGEASPFSLSADGYAVEFAVRGEPVPSLASSSRSRAMGRFFAEFTSGGGFDGWVVVGSPAPHGRQGTQARDGHYAVQLGFALGQHVRLPERFPVKLDVDVRSEKLEGSNLIAVGGPRANETAEALNEHLPIRFRRGDFWVSIVVDQGNAYSSEFDCVVAKVANPWIAERTCVLAAGLTGAGTKAAIIGMTNYADQLFSKYREGDFACVLRGADRDGDGKVDSVEVLRQV